jgi:hypothetical protein
MALIDSSLSDVFIMSVIFAPVLFPFITFVWPTRDVDANGKPRHGDLVVKEDRESSSPASILQDRITHNEKEDLGDGDNDNKSVQTENTIKSIVNDAEKDAPETVSNWRCACEGGFLPPGMLQSMKGMEAVFRMSTGECYHKKM